MRKGRFSEEQMVAIIREGDRDPVAAVAKRHGISEQTIYTWRKRFGALQANDVKRLRQFEAENARLKKLVAERDLEIEVMKEVAAVHAAEDLRKVTVVSLGLFGDQGVFRREATGAAQIVGSRFGHRSVVVRFNTKRGGGATVEALAATLNAEAKKDEWEE